MRPINNGTYEIRRNISLLLFRYDTTMKYSKYFVFYLYVTPMLNLKYN